MKESKYKGIEYTLNNGEKCYRIIMEVNETTSNNMGYFTSKGRFLNELNKLRSQEAVDVVIAVKYY